MTQDEIIRMAQQAGIAHAAGIYMEHLERFAALVAAHECKKFMAVCEAEYNKYDALITEEDAGHEEAVAIIHLMRKLSAMK